MKTGILMCLALTLLSQVPPKKRTECAREHTTQGSLDGHWWIQASSCERLLYAQAFGEGDGLEPSVPAIDRFYENPKYLDIPIKTALRRFIWGSANRQLSHP